MSSEKNADVYIVPETVPGTTPATPNWIFMRKTSGASLGIDRSSFVSNEMSSDGEVQAVTLGGKTPSGSLNFELSMTTFKEVLEAALRSSFVADTPSAGTNQLKGGNTKKTFSVLAFFSDLAAGTKRYWLFTGCEINDISMTFPAEGIVTGSFSFIGRTKTGSTSAPAGSVFGPSNGLRPFETTGGIMRVDGSQVAYTTEVSFTLANGLEPKRPWGSNDIADMDSARKNVTGTLGAFFDDASILIIEGFEAGSGVEFAVDWTVQDPHGNAIKFSFPAAKPTAGRPDISGTQIPVSFPFQAVKDTAAGTSIVIEETAA